MTLVVPNSAETIILEYILNKSAPENLDIKLYSNDVTPSETDTIATYTEVSGGGYIHKELTPASWSISPGNPTTSEHTQVSWDFTGSAGLGYGYFIVRRSSGELLWAERFTNGPYNITQSGDAIKVTPRLNLE
jgi:hypothetical protein